MVDLAGPALLKAVSPETGAWMAGLARRCNYADGEFLHVRGDTNTTMDVVIEGQIRLVRLRPDGTETIATTINPGQHIADIVMLGDFHRSHTAVAVGRAVVDHYNKAAFAQLIENHEVLLALYKIACFRLAMTISTVDDLRSLSREAHLGKVLYAVSAKAGCGEWFDIVQEDLASLLGVSAMTIAKSLTKLKKEGLIETGYRKIRVPNRKALKAWVDREQAD